MLYFLVYFEMSLLLMLSKLATKGSQQFFMGYFLLVLPLRRSVPGIFKACFISVSHKTFLMTREDIWVPRDVINIKLLECLPGIQESWIHLLQQERLVVIFLKTS